MIDRQIDHLCSKKFKRSDVLLKSKQSKTIPSQKKEDVYKNLEMKSEFANLQTEIHQVQEQLSDLNAFCRRHRIPLKIEHGEREYLFRVYVNKLVRRDYHWYYILSVLEIDAPLNLRWDGKAFRLNLSQKGSLRSLGVLAAPIVNKAQRRGCDGSCCHSNVWICCCPSWCSCPCDYLAYCGWEAHDCSRCICYCPRHHEQPKIEAFYVEIDRSPSAEQYYYLRSLSESLERWMKAYDRPSEEPKIFQTNYRKYIPQRRKYWENLYHSIKIELGCIASNVEDLFLRMPTKFCIQPAAEQVITPISDLDYELLTQRENFVPSDHPRYQTLLGVDLVGGGHEPTSSTFTLEHSLPETKLSKQEKRLIYQQNKSILSLREKRRLSRLKSKSKRS